MKHQFDKAKKRQQKRKVSSFVKGASAFFRLLKKPSFAEGGIVSKSNEGNRRNVGNYESAFEEHVIPTNYRKVETKRAEAF